MLDRPWILKYRRLARKVFTPKVLLAFMSAINLLNYVDRGMVSAILGSIKSQFGISDTEAGLMASSFMIGFMLTAPIFAQLARRIAPTLLMFVGLLVWCTAAVLCASSTRFGLFVFARSLAGVGEASFCGLAPSSIDSAAPPAARSVWLAIFFSAIPAGYACGYLLGGMAATYSTWRLGFIVEMIAMLPLAILCLVVPDPAADAKKAPPETADAATERSPIKTSSPLAADDGEGETRRTLRIDEKTSLVMSDRSPQPPPAAAGLATDEDTSFPETYPDDEMPLSPHEKGSFADMVHNVKLLVTNPIFTLNCAGYAALTFALGSYAFWMPYFLEVHYGMPLAESTLTFGAVALCTGLGGTAFGGWIVDRAGGSVGAEGTVRSLQWCWRFTAISLPFIICCFFFQSVYGFFVFLLIAEFVLFATTSPTNGAALSAVPDELRSHAMAIQIFSIHLFGDVPSPVLVGLISDKTSLFLALFLLSFVLCFSVIFWFLAAIFAQRKAARVAARQRQRAQARKLFGATFPSGAGSAAGAASAAAATSAANVVVVGTGTLEHVRSSSDPS